MDMDRDLQDEDKSLGTLFVELIGASGLQEETELLRTIKVNVIYDNETHQSSEISLSSSGECQLNFSFCLKVSQELLSTATHIDPITIYISQQFSSKIPDSILPPEQQPSGFSFTRTLLAQAVIDSRLGIVHKNDVLSAELVPRSNGGIIDSGFGGVLYLKLSFEAKAMYNQLLKDSLTIERIEDDMKLVQSHIEKLNLEQYQKLKSWYSKLRSQHPYLAERNIKLIALDEFGRHR